MEIKSSEPPPECFVSGALGTVLRVSRIAGIAPLQFEKTNHGWRVSISLAWNIYGCVMVTMYSLISIGALISDMYIIAHGKAVRKQSFVLSVVYVVKVTSTILISAMLVYGAKGQMRSLMASINQVRTINSEMKKNFWPKSSERTRTILYIFWVTVTTILVFTDQVITIIDSETWENTMKVFCYGCYWIMQMYNLQFVMIALHVKDSFTVVNDNLRTLLKSAIPKSCRSHRHSIRHLALMYTSVCDVVRDVDRCHGLALLMILCHFLFLLIGSPYFLALYLYNTSQDRARFVFNVVLQGLWCLFHPMLLFFIMEPCHLTRTEMETTRLLVSQLMRYTQSNYDPLAKELDWFYRHLVLNEVSYEPLKVIKMSRALVITILGAITTYLVIIIQLEERS